MHNHDPDLIFSLANGDLTGASADTATAAIAACAECSRDLELQRVAVDALQGLPAPALSTAERSSLRNELQTQLGLVSEPAPVAETQRRRLVNWSAIAVAAVVLTGVVLVGPLLGLLGGSDSDMGAPEQLAAVVEESGGQDDAATTFSRQQTTSAAAETTSTVVALAPAAESLADTEPLSVVEDGAGLLWQFDELDFELLRSTLDARDGEGSTAETDKAMQCAAVGTDELGAEFGTAFAVGRYQGRDAIAVAYTLLGASDPLIAIHDAETCEILATDP